MRQYIYTRFSICGHPLPKTEGAHVRCAKYNTPEVVEARRLGGSETCPDRARVEETSDNKCQECIEEEMRRERGRRRRERLERIFVGESDSEGGSEDEVNESEAETDS